MDSRIQAKLMSAEEAANLIKNDEVIGVSGFTPAGYPKAIPAALAKKAETLHSKGEEFQISLYSGASTGDEIDGQLTRAKAIKFRIPYQSHKDLRKAINAGEVSYNDMHLSHVAQSIRYGFIRKPTTAIIEAVEVTPDGKIYLSTAGGSSATYIKTADRIFIELNSNYGTDLIGYHDVYIPDAPPKRSHIPIYSASDKIGTPYVEVPFDKIAGIIETNLIDNTGSFKDPDAVSVSIANNILDFLGHERKKGRLPEGLPYQSGVGNVANAVLSQMAKDKNIHDISLYTEVIQDSIFDIIDNDKLTMGSTCALTLSNAGVERFKKNISNWKNKFVIRQQEISNHPEVIRRLGIISMNTALEADIYGNINSTHVFGSKLMNGIGGSGDFTRNCFLPIFMTPSTAKGGEASSIVPMVTHVDHSEHSTQIFVTENGLADLRGLSPVQRARVIIEKCAHEDFKPLLRDYLERSLKEAPGIHTPHILKEAFSFHQRLLDTGTMKI